MDNIRKPNYKNAENEALRLLQEFNYIEPPIDPMQIAKYLGIKVEMVKFDRSEVSGMYNYDSNIIYVNNNELPTRKLFTVAHELGHLRLHAEWVRSNDYKILLRSPHDNDPIELEADAFAAHLMMPKFMIEKYKNIATKEQLARIFAVSLSAIQTRLNFLNKIRFLGKKEAYEQW